MCFEVQMPKEPLVLNTVTNLTCKDSLEISRNDDIVAEMPAQGHTLLPVNQEAVILHFDVLLQALLVATEVLQGVVGLLQLVLQVLDALVQLRDLLHQLVVRSVVAVLHVGTAEPLLKAGLGHPQRRVFRGNLTF